MEVIKKYFKELTSDQESKYKELSALYEDWNAKINVISRKDMDQFYINHVLHSLAIAKIHDLSNYKTVMDIGTGGGFPGIPLAILYPNIEFTLVDSIQKKTRVVFEVAESLDLENVTVVNDRFENLKEKHDVIVSRAVAPALKLVNFTKKSIKKDGIHIFLKGGDLNEERKELLQKHKGAIWKESPLSEIYSEAFFETKKVIELSKL
jgi:16S rRNA (guanine527-N7)-methyltransferase